MREGGVEEQTQQTQGRQFVDGNASASATADRPKQRWLWGVGLGVTAMVSAVVGAGLSLVVPLPPGVAPEGADTSVSMMDLWQRGVRYEVTRPINVLVMGIDQTQSLNREANEGVFDGNSDVMLLLHIDPASQSVNVLSIPRDTQAEIPGVGVTKINHANVAGGPALASQTVSNTLNGVEIDRYVRVSTGAFKELVDLVGGVDVFVPEDMSYTDNTQKLKIDLKAGQQTLDGEQAEQFARFRNDGNGDVGRVQRQQQLIRALREKITSPAMLPRIPQAVQIFQKNIDTNLSIEEMLALVNLGLDLDQDNFRMVMLPGRFSQPGEFVASYWLMDEAAMSQVMADYFEMSPVAVLSHEQSRSQLRVAVQNATDEPHLGTRVATYLQSQGFNNVYVIDDYPDHRGETQIIAQRGDLQSAASVESALGVGQVVAASTGDLYSDITVRVGNDWKERPDI